MVDAIERTAFESHMNVEIYAGLDEDDEQNYDLPLGVRCLIRPRQRLAAWTNELAAQALADGAEILAFFGDDHRPRTAGWDDLVLDAFETMGGGLVYGRDGLQDERLPTAPFWSADVIRALGWFYPPTLTHLYADDYWLALANDLGRRTYLPDVYIEHLHPSATNADGSAKAEADDLNRENDSFYEQDRDEFLRILREDHAANLQRVREALGV
jgi:hypothetical protein